MSRSVSFTSSGTLFQKLYPRPNGLPRAQVISHQRERLCRALLTAVAQNGYERTTIGQLCTLAGVSKRSFYEIFAGKPDCLAAAHERVIHKAVRRMSEAPFAASRPQEALGAAIAALLAEAARRPDATRFALLDAVDATAPALQRRRWAAGQLEHEIADRLADTGCLRGAGHPASGQLAPANPLALRGIVAGLSHVICTRVLADRAEELPQLVPQLTRWALACTRLASKPRLAGLGLPASLSQAAHPEALGEQPHPDPSGTRLFALRDESTLMMESALFLVSEGGMLRLSPETLASHSGIPSRRLNALFGDCQQCLLEALRQGGEQLLDGAIGAAAEETRPQPVVQRGLLTLLRDLDAHRHFARALFVEAHSLGPRGHAVRAGLVERAAGALRQPLTAPLAPSDIACEASVAAVWELVADELIAGTRGLRMLCASAQALLLAPWLAAVTTRHRFDKR